MYYNGSELKSKNRILNFIIGNRGGGKTFWAKCECINDFLKNGKEFVWLRRYNSELEDVKTWTNDIQGFFPNNEIEVKGKKVYIDKKLGGYILALSTSQRAKSIPFPNVNKIVFDEFLIDKGSLRYIKCEVELMLEFIETVFRSRDDNNRVYFIGNAISIVNPYFTYFKIKPDLEKEYTMNKDIVIHLYKNAEFIENKKKTRFGRLIDKTEYGAYAIDNKFLRDNYSFIKERPKSLSYSFCIVYEGAEYGVWNNFREDELYIDRIIENNNDKKFVVNLEDLTEGGKFRKWNGWQFHLSTLKFYFNDGTVYYSDLEVKKKMYEVIKLI